MRPTHSDCTLGDMSRISTGQADRRVSPQPPAMPHVDVPAPPEMLPAEDDSPVPVGTRMRVIFYLALGLWLVIGAVVVAVAV